jgi:hypothetical protein
MLLPGVALLLSSEEDFSILEESCSTIVVVAGDAENVGGSMRQKGYRRDSGVSEIAGRKVSCVPLGGRREAPSFRRRA